MNNYPKYAQVNEKKYKINTDFKVALRCNEIAKSNISDEERAIAIIYLLFSDEGLNNPEDWEKLLKISLKYLNFNKEIESNEEEANMSFEQDWGYIQASFFSDYNIDLSNIQIHWYQFYDLVCGLTEKCILNRVRFVRDFDISQIKDSKEKQKWIKQKEMVALKKEKPQKTEEEIYMDNLFKKQLEGG